MYLIYLVSHGHYCYIVIILFFHQGYGVFTREGFRKGDILMEYKGDLISAETADLRREEYSMKELGNFIYDVEHRGKVWWYDLNSLIIFGMCNFGNIFLFWVTICCFINNFYVAQWNASEI